MSSVSRSVLLQNVVKFTVQIRHATTNQIKGTGFVVSLDGKIVTCRHVVRDASAEKNAFLGVEVGIYFPQLRDKQERRAKAIAYFEDYEDDVAILQLLDEDTPIAPEDIAILGSADENTPILAEANPLGDRFFQSYGYGRLPNTESISKRIEGKILGTVEWKETDASKYLRKRIELSAEDIRPGTSGAAVLDKQRNLVVGIISRRFLSDPESDRSRENNLGWAVDAFVLSFDPMNLPLRTEPLPLRPAPIPADINLPQNKQNVIQTRLKLENAPQPLPEWVGREDLLAKLDEDWQSASCNVTGLIGFGGEGKSSAARQWIENLLKNRALIQPEGVFWWGFYEDRNVDKFYEKAVEFLTEGLISQQESSSRTGKNLQNELIDEIKVLDKTRLIRLILRSSRYLFVLDGIEIFQHQEGDNYGLLSNNKLREFLQLFAAGGHESFCVVTSRAPLLDFINYTTYQERSVERLTEAEGRQLLKNVGVKGSDEDLERVVRIWDGYAIVLSLLGAYSVDVHGGKVENIFAIETPEREEDRYDRIQRIVRRYNEHLSDAEKEFLLIFSAFRLPVFKSAFVPVFWEREASWIPKRKPVPSRLERWLLKLWRKYILRLFGIQWSQKEELKKDLHEKSLTDLKKEEFDGLISRLCEYRILKYFPQSSFYSSVSGVQTIYQAESYTIHPLIQQHYQTKLNTDNSRKAKGIHKRIADHYLDICPLMTNQPKLEEFTLLIEVVHHLCQSGNYARADNIFWERISQKEKRVLGHQLGAWNVNLEIWREFFPNRDISLNSNLDSFCDLGVSLNNTALCFFKLGDPRISEVLWQQCIEISMNKQNWLEVAINYCNLAELNSLTGNLTISSEMSKEAVLYAYRSTRNSQKIISLCWQAWILHLRGDLKLAETIFKKAEALEMENSNALLGGLGGNSYAQYLRKIGSLDSSRRVILSCLKSNSRIYDISQGYYILGDIEFDCENFNLAESNYQKSLKFARSTSDYLALIEALIARGRYYTKQGEVEAARQDLEEVLNYAVDSGYRLYEADIRIARSWMHLAENKLQDAQIQAERAKKMSQEMGYHWGQVDADEVLEILNTRSITQEH